MLERDPGGGERLILGEESMSLTQKMTVQDFKGQHWKDFRGQAEKAGFCSVGRKESQKVLSQGVIRWRQSKDLEWNGICSKDEAWRTGIAGQAWGSELGGWDTGRGGGRGWERVKNFELLRLEQWSQYWKYRKRCKFRVCRRWIILGVHRLFMWRGLTYSYKCGSEAKNI